MTFEKFKEILHWKFNKGIKSFNGNLSGKHYKITNNGSKNGWSLFVNNSPAQIHSSFYSIAWKIWDIEMGYAMPPETR